MRSATALAVALLLVPACFGAGASGQVRVPESRSDKGWQRSFTAGEVDDSGRPIGGTEIVHLASHKGRLYAGNGYWMDSRGYANIPWSQVLVLDSPRGTWKVDLALGSRIPTALSASIRTTTTRRPSN
jgi:hypothetical protein